MTDDIQAREDIEAHEGLQLYNDDDLWINQYAERREKARKTRIVRSGAALLFVLIMYAVCLPPILGIFRTIMMWVGFGDVGGWIGG